MLGDVLSEDAIVYVQWIGKDVQSEDATVYVQWLGKDVHNSLPSLSSYSSQSL
jgi:hypothetical protein